MDNKKKTKTKLESKTKLENNKIKPQNKTNNKTKKQESNDKLSKGQLFGLISGSVTTIGIIIGLWQSHNNVSVIISAIMSIALSDSFSDGFGMYFSQRTTLNQSDAANVGINTAFYKIIVTLSYIIPFLVMDIDMAVKISITWGCVLIGYASYQIGEGIFINLLMAVIVMFMSYLGGNIVKMVGKMLESNTATT